ncbi:MAG: DUF3046 domain-containing protein [Rothia sp. (in: high G+C Gram-positive bacteria)]|nr:DUF3046 domain-containing protein [Rothia sp. (in: high G+C Gram-positive bacteria)]
MKLSEFWRAMDHEFGAAYAHHLARDLGTGDFGDLTVQQALEGGANVQEVWRAVCRVQDVPRERWYGPDIEPKG